MEEAVFPSHRTASINPVVAFRTERSSVPEPVDDKSPMHSLRPDWHIGQWDGSMPQRSFHNPTLDAPVKINLDEVLKAWLNTEPCIYSQGSLGGNKGQT